MLPRWVSWLFIAFMAYLIYTGNHAQHLSPSSPAEVPDAPHPQALPSTADYPALQRITNGNDWRRAMNPTYVGAAKITDARQGHGDAAQCGSEVTIHLRGTLSDGANFDALHNETQPLTFALGDAPYAVLNDALVGMQAGGVRQISAPPQLVYAQGVHKSRDDVMLRVEMDAVEGDAPAAGLGIKILRDAEGTGQPARCGAPMKVAIKLWNTEGGIAYATTQPITLALGKDDLPQGFIRGLNTMLIGEIRTLVLPPASADDADALPAEIRKALASGHVAILTVERQE